MRALIRSLLLAAACAASPIRAAESGPLLEQFGPTRPGDSFWNIAQRIGSPSGASIVRLHRRLIRDNAHAMIDGDPDRLRLGVLIDVRGPVPMAARGWRETAEATDSLRAASPGQPHGEVARAWARAPQDMAASASRSHDDLGQGHSMAASTRDHRQGDMAASASHAGDEFASGHSMAASARDDTHHDMAASASRAADDHSHGHSMAASARDHGQGDMAASASHAGDEFASGHSMAASARDDTHHDMAASASRAADDHGDGHSMAASVGSDRTIDARNAEGDPRDEPGDRPDPERPTKP